MAARAKPPRRDPDRGVTPRYITEESPRNAGLASSKPACQLFCVLSEIEFLDHTSSEATSRCRSSSSAHASRSQASRSSTGCRTASWNSDSICCHRFNLPPGFYTPDVRRHPIRGGLVLGIELYEIIAKGLSLDGEQVRGRLRWPRAAVNGDLAVLKLRTGRLRTPDAHRR